jgi:hypothetical protein
MPELSVSKELRCRRDAPKLQQVSQTSARSFRRAPAWRRALMLWFKHDDNVGCLGLVRFQAAAIGIAPTGNIHDHCGLDLRARTLGRLDDVQSVAGEEEGVLAEQFVESGNDGMIVWNSLGIELAQGSFDLCGRQFH